MTQKVKIKKIISHNVKIAFKISVKFEFKQNAKIGNNFQNKEVNIFFGFYHFIYCVNNRVESQMILKNVELRMNLRNIKFKWISWNGKKSEQKIKFFKQNKKKRESKKTPFLKLKKN